MGGSFHQIIASTREGHLSIALYAQHTYWTNTVLACPKVSQAVWVLIDRKADMRLLLVAHLLLPGTLLAIGIWIEFDCGQLVCPCCLQPRIIQPLFASMSMSFSDWNGQCVRDSWQRTLPVLVHGHLEWNRFLTKYDK